MRVIVGCEFSQIVTKAFRERGHEAYSCDLLPTEGNPKWHFQEDILELLKREKFDLGIFHPPCTYLAVSGNKWLYHPEDANLPIHLRRPHPNFLDRRQKQLEALVFFKLLANAPIPKICVENPVGVVSSMWRRPDQYVHPYYFGDPHPKKTGLWLKNLPLLVPTKMVQPEVYTYKDGRHDGLWHVYTFNLPKEERSKVRSRTFQGIANAMANQWSNLP